MHTCKVPVLIVNTQATTEADAIDDLDVTTAVAKVLALLPEYILAWGERKGVTSRSQDSSDVLLLECVTMTPMYKLLWVFWLTLLMLLSLVKIKTVSY